MHRLRRTLLLAGVTALLALSAADDTTSSLAALAPPGTLTTFWIHSAALGRSERTLVYLPPGYYADRTRRYPMVLLLHGVPGAPQDFVRFGVIGRIDYLMRTRAIPPMVVAMPAGSDRPGDDNEWADSTQRPGERWESYVATDVVLALDRRFRLIYSGSARGIGGPSMGGFGAVNIALHHRTEFAAVTSWSGYFNSNTPSVHAPGSPGWLRDSPQHYAASMRPSLTVQHPAIDIYTGSADAFRAEVTTFAATLTRLRAPHGYRVYPGAGHTWALWASHVGGEMAFYGKALTPSRVVAGGLKG